MTTNGIIKIEDLIDHLKANNLIIIDRHEYQKSLENDPIRAQTQLLKKKSATLAQIAATGILQVTSKQALRKWIENGTIQANEWYRDQNGVIMVDMAGVKRIQMEKDLHI